MGGKNCAYFLFCGNKIYLLSKKHFALVFSCYQMDENISRNFRVAGIAPATPATAVGITTNYKGEQL